MAEAIRETVRSERGKTEGIIGTLKTDKYGFNKPKERLWQTLEMAGPRSILSFNLNKFMRDVYGPTGRDKKYQEKKSREGSYREARRRPRATPLLSKEFCDTLYLGMLRMQVGVPAAAYRKRRSVRQ